MTFLIAFLLVLFPSAHATWGGCSTCLDRQPSYHRVFTGQHPSYHRVFTGQHYYG